MQAVDKRPRVNGKLIEKVRKKLPETIDMTDTGLINYVLRKAIKEAA